MLNITFDEILATSDIENVSHGDKEVIEIIRKIFDLIGDIEADKGTKYFTQNEATISAVNKAIEDGYLPMLTYYIDGVPVVFICCSHDSNSITFYGVYNGVVYEWRNETYGGASIREYEFAKIYSPTFTGEPKAPTPPESDYSTRIANTIFVKDLVQKNKGLKTFDNISDMVDNFIDTDVVCYVLCDDSPWCASYKGNYYKYFADNATGRLALTNGGYADFIIPEFAPLKSNVECVSKMREIGESYHNYKWGQNQGPFRTSASQHNDINCSQFVNAVLQGLYCDKSKLEAPENTFIDGGCSWLKINSWRDANNGCLLASDMARFAAAHGWLVETKQFKDVEPGDVVFFNRDTESALNAYWHGIAHCGIVTERKGHATQILMSGDIHPVVGGDPARMSPISYGTGSKHTGLWGVRYFVVLDDDKDYYGNYTDGEGNTYHYGLFGFARFPVYYGEPIDVNSYPSDSAQTIAPILSDCAAVPVKNFTMEIPYRGNPLDAIYIYRSGKNIVDIGGFYTTQGTTDLEITPSENKLKLSTSAANATCNYKCDIPRKATKITVSADVKVVNGTASLGVYNLTGTTYAYSKTTTVDDHLTFVIGTNNLDVRYIVRLGYIQDENMVGYAEFSNIQVEFGNSATTFEPYKGQIIQIEMDQDTVVYGGSFDLTSGILLSTKASDGTDLETPVSYQLYPQPLNTHLGYNNIWARWQGQIELEYRADPTLYIDKMINSIGE